jgi:AcrR family transcriptional regulator
VSTVQERGVASRARLVQAAIELFAENGSRGTGIAAVANRAGVTQATLIHHFGSKQGLLTAVLEENDARASREGGAWDAMVQLGGLAALRQLPRFADWWLREPVMDRLRMILAAESLEPSSPIREYFARRQTFLRSGIRSIIESGQRAGEIRDVDARTKAIEIVSMLHGLNEQWLLDPERIPIKSVLEEYTQDLVRSLAVP